MLPPLTEEDNATRPAVERPITASEASTGDVRHICGAETQNVVRKTQKSRRRPIFPKGCPLSIFGAGELNFRVRDGNGCGLSARVTRISCGLDSSAGQVGASAEGRSLARARHRSKSSSSNESCLEDRLDSQPTDPWSVAEEVKPSTVSTAQLHPSPDFHMRPIKQVVSLRSYSVDPMGNLILRRASHLDAFSAYPDRT